MGVYFIKRLFLIIPAVLGVVLVSFIINASSGTDPLNRIFDFSQNKAKPDPAQILQQKKIIKHQTGLDLPIFYFSITSLAEPDTLERITENNEQKMLAALIKTSGNWPLVSAYYLQLKTLENTLLFSNTDSLSDSIVEFRNNIFLTVKNLLNETYSASIDRFLNDLGRFQSSALCDVDIKTQINAILTAHQSLQQNPCKWKNYIPTLSFHFPNQFHLWLFGDSRNEIQETYKQKGLLHGDLGISYRNKQPVWELLLPKMKWSFILALFSILIAYLISIPLGLIMAKKNNSKTDTFLSYSFYLLYAVPVFWMGLLLLMLFANPDVFPILPASGVMPPHGFPENSTIFEKLFITMPYLILPVICYTYSFAAFLSRITKVTVLETLPMDFIRTARAKGISENRIMYTHAFRNALLPLITVFVNIFPLAVGGSVIIETMFSIPGLGFEIYNAAMAKDFPVITAVFMLTAFFTMAGYLAGDMIYALADPRIKYKTIEK